MGQPPRPNVAELNQAVATAVATATATRDIVASLCRRACLEICRFGGDGGGGDDAVVGNWCSPRAIRTLGAVGSNLLLMEPSDRWQP